MSVLDFRSTVSTIKIILFSHSKKGSPPQCSMLYIDKSSMRRQLSWNPDHKFRILTDFSWIFLQNSFLSLRFASCKTSHGSKIDMDFYIGYGARIGFNLSWSWSSSNLFCSARLFGPVVNNRCLMLFELLLIIVKHLLLPLPMWKFKIQLPFSVLKTISRQFLVVIVARYVSPFGVYATRSALSLWKMTQAFFALIYIG